MAIKALSDKWTTTLMVAERLGIKRNTVYQWKTRGIIPGRNHLALIREARGRLTMRDFVEGDNEKQHDTQ